TRAVAAATRRIWWNVQSSAMTPRHPSVPNGIPPPGIPRSVFPFPTGVGVTLLTVFAGTIPQQNQPTGRTSEDQPSERADTPAHLSRPFPPRRPPHQVRGARDGGARDLSLRGIDRFLRRMARPAGGGDPDPRDAARSHRRQAPDLRGVRLARRARARARVDGRRDPRT